MADQGCRFIASAGTYANLVKQAKSKQKIIDKMEAAGLVEKVETPRPLVFNFADVGKLPPPIIAFTDVAFSYSGKKEDYLYQRLNLGIECAISITISSSRGLKLMHHPVWTRVSPSSAQMERASRRFYTSSPALSSPAKAQSRSTSV